MNRTRRRKKLHLDENHDRWLISYADFVTLLFAFFVVMYAVSSVNEGKYRVLSDSISSAFGLGKRDTSLQINPVMRSPINEKVIPPIIGERLINQAIRLNHTNQSNLSQGGDIRLQKIFENIEQLFSSKINKPIQIIKYEHSLEIEIQSDLLFGRRGTKLSIEAKSLIRKVSDILGKYKNRIRVEGYTDNAEIKSTNYPSNWELSALRAASIVRMLISDGVEPRRLSAIGYGEFRPIASNDDESGRRRNRRVNIVILSEPANEKQVTVSSLYNSYKENATNHPKNILPPFRQD